MNIHPVEFALAARLLKTAESATWWDKLKFAISNPGLAREASRAGVAGGDVPKELLDWASRNPALAREALPLMPMFREAFGGQQGGGIPPQLLQVAEQHPDVARQMLTFAQQNPEIVKQLGSVIREHPDLLQHASALFGGGGAPATPSPAPQQPQQPPVSAATSSSGFNLGDLAQLATVPINPGAIMPYLSGMVERVLGWAKPILEGFPSGLGAGLSAHGGGPSHQSPFSAPFYGEPSFPGLPRSGGPVPLPGFNSPLGPHSPLLPGLGYDPHDSGFRTLVYYKPPPGIPARVWNDVMNRPDFPVSRDISRRYLDALNQLGGQ